MNRGLKLLSFIPLVLVLAILTVRVDYRIDAPGDLERLDGFITFENDAQTDAQLNAIYIMSFNRPTIFQWMIAQVFDSVDATPLSEQQRSITNTARFESGQVARNTAIDKAIITAYESLGLELEYEVKSLVYLIYDYAFDQGLEIGDTLVSVNGSTEIYDAFANATCGEDAEVDVIKESGETVSLMLHKYAAHDCRFGLSLSTYYDVKSLPLAYETTPTIVGGPSAGLMHTLYIYAAQNSSVNLSGLTIAGTGSIQLDGSVGGVGSIKQKVYTAHRQGVDLLLMPSGSNYETAKAVYDRLKNPSFELIEIATFEDALDAIEARS